MAPKAVVLPLLRRELRSPASIRVPNFTSSLRTVSDVPRRNPAQVSYPRKRVGGRVASFWKPQLWNQIRTFSQSLSRADEEEDAHFDPSQIERESDEVDVCIVGGGMCLPFPF